MSRRLPPLSSLRSFESAARLLSFSAAARELSVTPTAVSHQIRALEQWLGVKLFERTTRSVRLTDAGRRYAPSVRAAFEGLEQATSQIAAHGPERVVTVTVTTSFATKWLIPRLARFRERQPEVDVRISTQTASVDLVREGFDMGIRYGSGRWPGLISERLLSENVFPVCAPSLLECGPPLAKPGDLAEHTLLHVSSMPDDWRIWLTAAGATDVDPTHGITFDLWLAALGAAVDGVGVALGHTPLVERDLAAGRLVAPFRCALPNQFAYYIVYPEGALRSSAFDAFKEWLLSQRENRATQVRLPEN